MSYQTYDLKVEFDLWLTILDLTNLLIWFKMYKILFFSVQLEWKKKYGYKYILFVFLIRIQLNMFDQKKFKTKHAILKMI